MLLSAVSVLVVAQSSSEIPEGLVNNPVHCPSFCTLNCHSMFTYSSTQNRAILHGVTIEWQNIWDLPLDFIRRGFTVSGCLNEENFSTPLVIVFLCNTILRCLMICPHYIFYHLPMTELCKNAVCVFKYRNSQKTAKGYTRNT